MKLTKRQREKVLEWAAEGLETDEINKRAAKCKPPFKVLRSQVDYYRKTRGVDLDKLKKDGEQSALTSGLALKENRVQLLQKLADKMKADLFEKKKMWLKQVKGIGSKADFERVEYWEFNAAEVRELRGVLDDIAAEMNERIKRLEHSGPDGGPIPQQIVHIYIPNNSRDESPDKPNIPNEGTDASPSNISNRDDVNSSSST